VYGSLRSHHEAAHVLDPFTRSRTSGARVRGTLRRGGQVLARARFDQAAETAVVGEIVELDPDKVSAALEACLQAHEGYRLVQVAVELAGEILDAQALEWLEGLEDPGEHLTAAIAKVRIAQYHCHRLAQVGQDDPRDRVVFQAHAEGVLSSGVLAGNEVAKAFDMLLGYGLEPATAREFLRLVDRDPPPEYRDALAAFRAWWNEPLVRDAAELHELSTPHHYNRSPRGRQWVFSEVVVRDGAAPFVGPRGVLGYCVKYVSTLHSLELIAHDLGTPAEPTALPHRAG
jgi:hypothetical protein